MIEKIKIQNFRKFENLTINMNNRRNIFVGENGVGKSTILKGISYVLSGSYSAIEKVGFQSLFNAQTITDFMQGNKKVDDLPELIFELYFSDDLEPKNFDLKGRQNTDKKEKRGLQLRIAPNDDYSLEIEQALKNTSIFPFEYYSVEFNTFAGAAYSSYNRKHRIKFELIESSTLSSNFLMQSFIAKLYQNQSDQSKRQKISHDFREISDDFSDKLYDEYGLKDTSEYKLKVKSHSDSDFQNRITAHKDSIDINDLGQGEKILLGVRSSIESSIDDIHIVLIEEPESHLSFLNMHKLIELISSANEKQTFIATHNNMIASRLNLSNVILLSEKSCIKLTDLQGKGTARFFQKAPNSNVLDFILSKRAILVEGDAEYIVLEEFFSKLCGMKPYQKDISLISCGGKTFERYLEIAEILDKKVAVITDNDEDYENNIKKKYKSYEESTFIKVFSDLNPLNYTFEVCLYNENQQFYKDNFEKVQMSKGILQYLLNNKAEASFRLLEYITDQNYPNDFKLPEYLKEAIEWISK